MFQYASDYNNKKLIKNGSLTLQITKTHTWTKSFSKNQASLC
jgi:hypothetical protein